MTSREERERRRAARLEAEKREAAAQRRRMILGYAVAGALCLAVVAGLAIVITSGDDSSGQVSGEDLPENAHIVVDGGGSLNDAEPDGREGTEPPPIEQGDLETAAREAGCELRTDLPDEGANHVSDRVPEWDTNPPTSGDHDPVWQYDGAYLEADPVHTLHSLEHGRINIQYSPDLPEPEQLELKGVFDQDPAGMLFFPNPDMPYEVAATAWRQLLGCDRYEGRATLDAIRAFRDTFRGRGPEPFDINLPS